MLQTVNNSEKVLNECKTLFATKLDEILKKMAHLNVRDLPARIQSHSTAHEVQVKAKLGGLPYDSIRDLMAMDTLLINLNLAISLVSFFKNISIPSRILLKINIYLNTGWLFLP